MPDSGRARWKGIVYRRKGMHAGMHQIGSKHVQCESCRSPRIAACLANSTPSTSGCNHAGTLVIHDNDATWGDLALRHLERRRDGAIGKQPFATAQRQRIDLEPERIDHIMLHERLNEICTAVNVQIRPWLLLECGDFFRNVSLY